MDLLETIRTRRSVRTFDGQTLSPEDRAALLELCADGRNPWALPIRFSLLDARAHSLSSPVIVGTELWLAGAVRRPPHAEEAYGWAFENLLLRAAARGLGTVWIAGTFNRDAFEAAMELGPDEVMPCASPVGHAAEKMSLRETVMRKGTGAASRAPFEKLFFDGTFERPLSVGAAGADAPLLEAVRRAPSAVNRQPWRVVRDGKTFHFYEKHSRGYVDKTGWDLQKVDLGIALCHFALAAEALGRSAALRLGAPDLPTPEDVEYTASCTLV